MDLSGVFVWKFSPAKIGACAMTTKFLEFNICTFQFLLSLWDHFPLCPNAPTPPQIRKFYFDCRLAVSADKRGEREPKTKHLVAQTKR